MKWQQSTTLRHNKNARVGPGKTFKTEKMKHICYVSYFSCLPSLTVFGLFLEGWYLEHLGIRMENKCFDKGLIQPWNIQDEKEDLWALLPVIKEA